MKHAAPNVSTTVPPQTNYSLSLWERAGVRVFAQRTLSQLKKIAARNGTRSVHRVGVILRSHLGLANPSSYARKVRRDAPYGCNHGLTAVVGLGGFIRHASHTGRGGFETNTSHAHPSRMMPAKIKKARWRGMGVR